MKQQSEGGFLIDKVHHLSGRSLTRKLKEHGINDLNPAQGRIMFVLWRRGRISIQQLARETGLGKSTLTSMLDRLERSGHITREPSGTDRRKIMVFASGVGRDRMDKYIEVSKEMAALFYRGFSQEEISHFESYLQRILVNFS